MKTDTPTKQEEIIIDAEGQILGRLATRIAYTLMGKDKPSYERHELKPVPVKITNASKVKVSGQKQKQKIYTRFTGYPSGLKKRTYEEQLEKDPTEIIRTAVWGMLPKNKLRKQFIKYLTIEK
ncbi:MAG: 50S ribosomal protein L13 [Candidatus Niyogibacteria bacterium CG10_big_fil_rev_8_21_14_0_10_46_36]|uniref:Large ribosomal subunit protein uL13 n=1 Tax=Candidatus Niyogibacteria bacterium CG10_big_fil_rev_8_21_14_0_10_46_36 TaxID=1974726 RepID=A0A2H0TEM4_9BACT|nr:MAG: 50S ribosomal protein L13 [Candidatus Niyogibacteria bacterium CG10_big_fil_rev_8_21_14_0_10_46_36]